MSDDKSKRYLDRFNVAFDQPYERGYLKQELVQHCPEATPELLELAVTIAEDRLETRGRLSVPLFCLGFLTHCLSQSAHEPHTK